MSAFLPSLVYQLGVGALGGFIAGYAVKKVSKFIIVLLGLFTLFILYLGVTEVISIDYDAFWNALARFFGFASEAATWIIGLIALFPLIGSFLTGFLLGFKLG